ncbi:MAG: polyprenyl synthetase family protein [Acidimicrobiia bacterium]|nr:polyprenyl synthetase family protein [Acidimicrobiia bacterium]
MDRPVIRDLVPIDRVWTRLEKVEKRLFEATTSQNEFLTEIAQHLLGAGGKRYRPLLAQVAAELGPDDGDGPVEAGVAVELVHVGSLYHDDVIDEAESRRRVVSVNANWNNTVAILGGDFLLARASEIAAPLGREAVELLSQTEAALCEGQILELQLGDDLEHGADRYYRVIELKTASLIRTSARLGAMAAGASPAAIEAASKWGHEIGMVFQLTDDVLDLIATDEFLGKPAGSDIGEGTFTLPVLNALEGSEGGKLRDLLSPPRPYSDDTVEQVIDLVRAGGYVEAVVEETRGRIRAADAAIAGLPSSGITEVLSRLGEYLLDRVETARP